MERRLDIRMLSDTLLRNYLHSLSVHNDDIMNRPIRLPQCMIDRSYTAAMRKCDHYKTQN